MAVRNRESGPRSHSDAASAGACSRHMTFADGPSVGRLPGQFHFAGRSVESVFCNISLRRRVWPSVPDQDCILLAVSWPP